MVLICVVSAAWAFSFGLGSQVISHWLKEQGKSDGIIGLNYSTYYLGLGLASLGVPRLMRRWGWGCAAVGLALSGLSLGLFPWCGHAGCFLLRFVNGAASGMSLIPLETLISVISTPAQRTRNFGFYGVALTLSGAVGMAGLQFYVPGQAGAFYLCGLFPLAGCLVMVLGLRWPGPKHQDHGDAPSMCLDRKFLSFGTAWSQGFLEGGMLAFMSLFLMSLGLSRHAAGGLMGVTMVGVILFQVPVSWLADRLGKTPVLLGSYAVVIATLVALPWCVPSPFLVICLFVFGAFCGGLYPLGLSLLGEGVPESSLARLYAWYMAMECLGSQVGAAAMGKFRDCWGEGAMFAAGLLAIGMVLLGWLSLVLLGPRGSNQKLPERSPTSRAA
jgi:MFS family permease